MWFKPKQNIRLKFTTMNKHIDSCLNRFFIEFPCLNYVYFSLSVYVEGQFSDYLYPLLKNFPEFHHSSCYSCVLSFSTYTQGHLYC